MPRIAIAGFQHETNTFGVTNAAFEQFEIADSWPALLVREQVLTGTKGINLPTAGFASAALCDPTVELIPILWCAAEPCAHVTDDAFDRISGAIVDGLESAGKLDGVYLDLHGAMVTETYDDGEGELLRRVRSVVGNELPITVSLDLHANISNAMVQHASMLAIYRTYPHLDMAETGARSFAQLRAQIDGGCYKKAFRQVPFLIPLSAQYTGSEPCHSIYAMVDQLSCPPHSSVDVALGFTAADIADAGPSIVSYACDQETADRCADQLMDLMLSAEDQFDCELFSPNAAVREAMAVESDRPVIIADVQDNPGAGATSDTTGLLTALLEEQAQGAFVGLMHDSEIANEAHLVGVGSIIDGALGGKSGVRAVQPYKGRFKVEALSSGECKYTGEMYGGGIAILGPCAVLRIMDVEADVRVVVTHNRSQCLDLALFTHIGIDPRLANIIVVKSTVHFRADFEPIAETVISSAASGVFPCQLQEIAYQNLRNGVRLGPMGPPFVSKQY